jgi:hypothetical protein
MVKLNSHFKTKNNWNKNRTWLEIVIFFHLFVVRICWFFVTLRDTLLALLFFPFFNLQSESRFVLKNNFLKLVRFSLLFFPHSIRHTQHAKNRVLFCYFRHFQVDCCFVFFSTKISIWSSYDREGLRVSRGNEKLYFFLSSSLVRLKMMVMMKKMIHHIDGLFWSNSSSNQKLIERKIQEFCLWHVLQIWRRSEWKIKFLYSFHIHHDLGIMKCCCSFHKIFSIKLLVISWNIA